MRASILLIFLAAATASGQPTEVTFAEAERYLTSTVGEASGGFPNWSERVIHQWMNRVRVDPQAALKDCAGCGEKQCYAPMPPLGWAEGLSRAARFHSDSMRKQSFFAHDTPCQLVPGIAGLYPNACDGSAACACKAPGITNWRSRIGMFGQSGTGEVIAGGTNPNTAFLTWLYENSLSTDCSFSQSNGHRWLILKSEGVVGVGVSSNSSVADFGSGATPLKIVSGAHYPRQAESVEIWANWFDFAGPRSASVVVDGKCQSMILRRGTPQNGAYQAIVTGVGSGCRRYYFVFTDSSGAVVTYPTTGSLGIGDSNCADWNASRSIASCSTGPAPAARARATRRQ